MVVYNNTFSFLKNIIIYNFENLLKLNNFLFQNKSSNNLNRILIFTI